MTVTSHCGLGEPALVSLNSDDSPHTLCLIYPVIRGMSCLVLLAALLLCDLITTEELKLVIGPIQMLEHE
jgi:hypothetical protein